MPLDRAALDLLKRKRLAGLSAVAVSLTGAAKQIAVRHNDNGTRANSITHAPSSDGQSVLWGIPVNSAPHGPHLEFGFRPHFVPARYVGLWMQRHGVGILKNGQAVRGKVVHGVGRKAPSLRARGTSVSMGVYVGGPGSSLQTAPGGATGRRYRGRKWVTGHWHTKGGQSKFLDAGKVGHPVLQPAVEQANADELQRVFKRGWDNGR